MSVQQRYQLAMADPGVQAPMHKNKKATLPRIQNFISSERFKDVNLVNRIYPSSSSASEYLFAII